MRIEAVPVFAVVDRVQPPRGAVHRQPAAGLFGVDAPVQRFPLAGASRWTTFADYLHEGVTHIGTGLDHILSLPSLLVPVVLVRRRAHDGHGWVGAPRFRAAFVDVVRVVAAFTVAHSITLSLAAIGAIALPTRLVESAIALSVVLAALNNVHSGVASRRWIVAFSFGLIHGFGFASLLSDLGLPPQARLVALVGFNLGVELGQLALVAAFLPLAFALRETRFYQRTMVIGASPGRRRNRHTVADRAGVRRQRPAGCDAALLMGVEADREAVRTSRLQRESEAASQP